MALQPEAFSLQPKLVAVTGKGGTGKSTVAAFLVRTFVRAGVRPILAVDADPNSTLAAMLGTDAGATISDIRDMMMREKYETTGVPKQRKLDLLLAEYVSEAEGFDIITMGRPEGKDCYCYVNNLLRHALAALRKNYRITIVDNEAGMEHLSRMNTDNIDCLLLVSEPTAVAAGSAARIAALASQLDITTSRRVLVWNKVPAGGVPESALSLLAAFSFDGVFEIPWLEAIATAAAAGSSISSLDPPEVFAPLAHSCIVDASSVSAKER